ncbi:MAG: 50S ribosomal protein L24 [Thaumarchaeota archaeon]|nr:50S ribosomal protein L24 [Nitrososphaerota archaeon]
MKPTTIRNRTIYQASVLTRSKLLCSHLSKDLQQKYHKRSVRVTEGDTVKVLRGEFKGVSGKITKISTTKSGVAVEGVKKEKLKGGNLDVLIHPSNLIVNDLNTEDKWRINKLEGKNAKPVKETKPKEAPKDAPKKETKPEPKKTEKKEIKKDTKESKAAKPAKKETK